jgi:hypothetical protein
MSEFPNQRSRAYDTSSLGFEQQPMTKMEHAILSSCSLSAAGHTSRDFEPKYSPNAQQGICPFETEPALLTLVALETRRSNM